MGQGQTKESVYCFGGCYIGDCNYLNDVSLVALEINDDQEEYECPLHSCLTKKGCICAPSHAYMWSGTVHCHDKTLEEIREREASSSSYNSSSSSSSKRGRTPSLDSSPNHSRDSSSVRTPDFTYRPKYNFTYFPGSKERKRSTNIDNEKNPESRANEDDEIQ